MQGGVHNHSTPPSLAGYRFRYPREESDIRLGFYTPPLVLGWVLFSIPGKVEGRFGGFAGVFFREIKEFKEFREGFGRIESGVQRKKNSLAL